MTRYPDSIPPRNHAVKILSMAGKDERRQYLDEQVPAEYRGLVESHVRAMWGQRGRVVEARQR